ncbi:hypothetical protein KIN20_010318 [Parelaphostrongylus tenuis]|uniref:Uncharacterized protein n=1 Tax=Parelaphostrongylus tenuis TaxID=148309 RepID=A0AAD5QP19_PARTN|nr:hypothetical protein KIN20_010318 [Parelaphostrongylus tenuis]
MDEKIAHNAHIYKEILEKSTANAFTLSSRNGPLSRHKTDERQFKRREKRKVHNSLIGCDLDDAMLRLHFENRACKLYVEVVGRRSCVFDSR